ncbi:MAG: 2-hydroxyacid dehydrogenase [Burkholderiaceae bacterium]|jgi:lactate dehydrogenase-like 2-hydroxyacid dehydrogenase|nr:2-hydroxyacid dehydrogenase [Burkholderiaceae bacterium]
MSQQSVFLVLVFLTEDHRSLLSEHFEVIYLPYEKYGGDRSFCTETMREQGSRIRFVLTNGAFGLKDAEMALMPKLEFVSTLGVGHEGVELDAAKSRNIVVCNTAGTNAEVVADHTMMLLLATIRRLPFLNREVRRGLWRDEVPRPRHISGRKMGIFGLGAVGQKLATRALAFDMQVGYHSRTRKDDLGFVYFANIEELAAWCDFLVLCAPAGPQTFHIVNRKVLNLLGPDGVLVNVARGSLVDTIELADAIKAKAIAGAALDVYEGEPTLPPALIELDDVVITPHIAGLSPEAMQAAVERVIENLHCHVKGQALISPV